MDSMRLSLSLLGEEARHGDAPQLPENQWAAMDIDHPNALIQGLLDFV